MRNVFNASWAFVLHFPPLRDFGPFNSSPTLLKISIFGHETAIWGATEKAGLELNGPTNFGGWKMQDWN